MGGDLTEQFIKGCMMTESQLPTSNNSSPLIRLRQLMVDTFSLDEIRTLCFDLHLNFDELPHPGLTPKIRSLIQLMIENGRFPHPLPTSTGPLSPS